VGFAGAGPGHHFRKRDAAALMPAWWNLISNINLVQASFEMSLVVLLMIFSIQASAGPSTLVR
jgi:hypothetical protein